MGCSYGCCVHRCSRLPGLNTDPKILSAHPGAVRTKRFSQRMAAPSLGSSQTLAAFLAQFLQLPELLLHLISQTAYLRFSSHELWPLDTIGHMQQSEMPSLPLFQHPVEGLSSPATSTMLTHTTCFCCPCPSVPAEVRLLWWWSYHSVSSISSSSTRTWTRTAYQ